MIMINLESKILNYIKPNLNYIKILLCMGKKTERRYAKMVVMIKSGVMSDFLVFFTTSVCNFYHRWEKNPLSLLLIHSSKISILSKLREESKNTNKLWVSHQYWILKD